MSERRPHLLLVGLIALALVGALLLAVPGSPLYKKPVLGLDLQGGLEVILQAVPPENRPLRESDLDRSLDIIRNRVDKLGLTEPEVTKQGSNQISASLPGVKDPDRVRDLIGSTAKLELYDLQTALAGPSIDVQGFPVATPRLYDLLSDSRTQSLAEEGKSGPFYLFRQRGKALVAGPKRTREALLSTDVAKKVRGGSEGVPKGYRVFGVPANTVIVTCGASAGLCPGANDATRTNYYLFRYNPDAREPVPEMTGADLRLNGTRSDFDTQTGRPIVLMQFTDKGADKFQAITREEAIRGQLLYNRLGQGGERDPFNQNFAIVLDREIQSYPSIDFQQYPNGISGDTGAQITGDFSVGEAKDLALVLQTGALPVEFRTLSETQISATLGEDSLRQALIAAVVGLLVVALFLLLFYRFLGLVAVIGLAIYALLLYAMILIFDVTLTLPGFAGMILTIGVAADANVVVFERIKEESRSGKSVRASIAAGYGKGFNTIIDANVVTAITALVLFALAAAGVRGFALMLLIGTAISLLTAVFATRAMLGLLAGFRWFDSPRFMGAQGQQTATWLQIDYIGKRRLWFAISGAVLAVAIGSIALKGLNLGIDFDGGTKISFATPRPVALEDVRDEARRIGQGNAILQGVGESRNDEYRQFQLRTETLAPGELARLQGGLRERLGVDAQAESFSVNTVSASFGRQIAESAVYAILISLLLVVLYITFRFQWKFAV
ncbi:MAG: protein translocase subunit SecD, partial [Actinobacteria bacterium]|nr:protein translocase subunit SecD [Actinomycetota bacterium]